MRCFRKVVRTNKWHSVEVRVRRDDEGGREIRLAADQSERWNCTYLTPRAARELARLLVIAARAAQTKEKP